MKFLVRFWFFFFYWVTPWYYGMTMTLTRKRRYPDVSMYLNMNQIDDALFWGTHWRPDPLGGVLDWMESPRKLQDRIDKGEKEIGDCEDHAIYWATALLKSQLCDEAHLGSVWYERDDKRVGHAVCVFKADGIWYWADYHNPTPFSGNWGWCIGAAKGGKPFCAGISQVTLRRSGEPKLRKTVHRKFF